MERILLSWIGDADLRAPDANAPGKAGPIATALASLPFDRALLLSDRAAKKVHRLREGGEVTVDRFLAWLRDRMEIPIDVRFELLSSPTNYKEIYEAARKAIDSVLTPGVELTFHVSPGTPAMGAVWLLLGKTHVPARLVETSSERGVVEVDLPFRIAVEFLPDVLRQHDERLREAATAPTPQSAAFNSILHKSDVMKKMLGRARRVALRDVPVLILGESGTGKELLAKAIHGASPRARGPMIAINCGAIPENLVESELFGHVKGAFTGADKDRKGHFEQAHGGTLFLDEIGELPLSVQVRLLRVLQQGEVMRVGASERKKVDVRVIAATHRDLASEIDAGRFREDLFYRLAVAVLHLPPLRERGRDRELLLEHLLGEVNERFGSDPGFVPKHLTAGARTVFLEHPWPGNVREMFNTLQRAALWSDGKFIDERDARESLLQRKVGSNTDLLHRPLGDGLDLRALVATLARHYLERAVLEAGGNKTKAAELVGMPSYQTLTNWMKKYDVELPDQR